MVIIVNKDNISQFNNTRNYNGEKYPGDLKNWAYYGTDPNELLRYTYEELSQKSTTLYHTHPPVKRAINIRTDYAIGQGLLFRSQPDWRILNISKDYAKDWSMRFQRLIHYMFLITNFYEKQSVLFRTAGIIGDSFLFFDRKQDGFFDMVEYGGDIVNSQKTGTTLGIYHDTAMRKSAVNIKPDRKVDFMNPAGDANIIQCYFKQMARQLRGFPLAYSVISAAKNNDRLHDAILKRAVLEATILGFEKNDDPLSGLVEQAAGLADLSTNTSSESGKIKEVGSVAQQPGTMYSYDTKGSIEFLEMKTPSNNFDKLQNCYIEMVAMATNTPPEVLKSLYSTSYTAHKGALNDFIKSTKLDRSVFANNVVKKVIIEIAKYLFLTDMIEMPHPGFFENPIVREATIAGNYIGPVPGHINPNQEVSSLKMQVDEAFKTRSQAALEFGNDFEDMIEAWHQENEEFNRKSESEKAEAVEKDLKEDENEQDENEQDENGDSDNE